MTSHDPHDGTNIAGYTLQSRVGEGGTSVVYRATHAEHGTVAVKVLKEKLRQDRTALARFLREAQLGELVVHPNVIRTIECAETPDGLWYLAIEWAPGDHLEKYAKRTGQLPRAEVAQIICQIAAAVHAAHTQGIVHRDLKPDNVMYDPASGQVKLLDFGIAAQTDTGSDERLTRAGFFVGTLMYVAPESLSGELVGPAADQYSLATIAYCLLTGCLPYTAKSPREMFTQLLSQPPTPLNRARAGLGFGGKVEAVIMRGLSKQPADRFEDVLVFAKELEEALLEPEAAEPEPAAEAGAGLMSRMRKMFGRSAGG